jgi:signal transduction histidine kinase
VARLHTRIYLHSLGVLLVVGLATTLVFALGALTTRETPRREVTARLVRHVAALVAERLADPPALERRLGQLRDTLEVDVTVRDAEGRIVAAVGGPLPAPEGRHAEEVGRGTVVFRARPVWHAVTVVGDGAAGPPRATVAVSAPRHLRPPSLWWPVLAVAVVLLAVALVTRPLARRLSRPLERLTEAARRLGQGDLGARVAGATPRRWWRPREADELRDLTAAFDEMAERVERTLRGQKELLANVSHELRSPLARLRLALALLPRDAESRRRVDDLERDLADLERLIDDVLTTARLDATGLPARLETVDVRRLLADLAGRAARDTVLAGLAVTVADGPPLALDADAALLRRALWNLVENAARHGAPPITLGATRDGERIVLSVDDAGPGVAPADRARVLEPFERGAGGATAGRPPGAGLGLTLARRVAEVHGGALTLGPAARVEGRETGCRVALVLPAARA